MIIKDLCETDFANYKKPAMFIIFPTCSFKCDKERGTKICQNSSLADCPNIEYPIEKIVSKYIQNPMTHAIVCGGLEPFDSWEDLLELVTKMRERTNDDFVIYTGYTEEEISEKIKVLKNFRNIIVKFGRYIPNIESHYDEILGVELASPNQYAIKISE